LGNFCDSALTKTVLARTINERIQKTEFVEADMDQLPPIPPANAKDAPRYPKGYKLLCHADWDKQPAQVQFAVCWKRYRFDFKRPHREYS
jgi:hypothetical protein